MAYKVKSTGRWVAQARDAGGRRMVDLDTFVAEVERVLRERAETFVSRRTRGAFFMAAEVVRDVFGGPTPSEDWRCECGDLNRDHEAFCYRCGAGQ